MTTDIAEKAASAMQNPEVLQILKDLSEYGLGVCLPHMHAPDTNEMVPLPPNMVQTEANLKVSFVERDKVDELQVPVAWLWDQELKTIQHCAVCQPPDGPHH